MPPAGKNKTDEEEKYRTKVRLRLFYVRANVRARLRHGQNSGRRDFPQPLSPTSLRIRERPSRLHPPRSPEKTPKTRHPIPGSATDKNPTSASFYF